MKPLVTINEDEMKHCALTLGVNSYVFDDVSITYAALWITINKLTLTSVVASWWQILLA